MDERTEKFEKLMKGWIYIGIAAIFLLVITIIMYYREKSWIQLVSILAQLAIVIVAIKYYMKLKKEKEK